MLSLRSSTDSCSAGQEISLDATQVQCSYHPNNTNIWCRVESTGPIISVDSPIMRRPFGLLLHWLLRIKVAGLFFNGATAHNGPRPLQKFDPDTSLPYSLLLSSDQVVLLMMSSHLSRGLPTGCLPQIFYSVLSFWYSSITYSGYLTGPS